MEKIKTALVGVGNWGKNLARELPNHTNLKYLAHNNSGETVTWIKEHFAEIKSTANLDEILNDPEIEAVAIATPIQTHLEIALRVLQAGKNVFLEKPATEKSSDIQILIDEAEKRNLVLQVGYEFTYSKKLREIKEQIGERPISKVSFEWRKWGSFNAHPVINLLVHELSILKSLGLNNIKITKYEEIKGENNPDSIHVEATSGETIITFDINRVSKTKEKAVTVETENNKYKWKDDGENLIGEEIEAFSNNVQNKTKPKTDGQFAKEILQIIETIPISTK